MATESRTDPSCIYSICREDLHRAEYLQEIVESSALRCKFQGRCLAQTEERSHLCHPFQSLGVQPRFRLQQACSHALLSAKMKLRTDENTFDRDKMYCDNSLKLLL
jgi:hypothetical protein